MEYRRGDVYMLYANFVNQSGTPIEPDNPQASIYYIQDGMHYPVIENEPMKRLFTGLYYYPHRISDDARDGSYLATVECEIDGILSRGTEMFAVGHVGGSIGAALISVVGTTQDELNVPLDAVEVVAIQGNNQVAKTVSDANGNWGLRLPPGEYLLHLTRQGYLARLMDIVVPHDQAWFHIDTIKLRPKHVTIDQGSGTRQVTDVVLDSSGSGIVNVRVRAYDVNDLETIVAQDYTDETGRWVLYLNPGRYLIKFYKYGYQVPDPITWDII